VATPNYYMRSARRSLAKRRRKKKSCGESQSQAELKAVKLAPEIRDRCGVAERAMHRPFRFMTKNGWICPQNLD
jgi:hypothetical protein